jgi:regulator of protease activity HflC (stomatin/prohibitin superfamily)
MSTFTEKTSISEFNIQSNGCISVRKTTEVLKDGIVISSTYWRCVLVPNDTQASTVLDEAYYLSIAQVAWTAEVVSAYQAEQARIAAEQEAQRLAAEAAQAAAEAAAASA